MSAAAAAAATPTTQIPPATRSGTHGRKHRNGRKRHPETENAKDDAALSTVTDGTSAPSEPDEVSVCWICAEPVKFYSLSACNHRTCHVCALRLRALYKRINCTFCKHPQTTLIFTHSADDPFEAFIPERIPFKDTKLSVFFETQDMMEEALILLRFNCPDPSCDFLASGWGDLKMHVRTIHGRSMCDMCIREKKVFAHEHVLYLPSQLPLHLPSIPRRTPHKGQMQERVEIEAHPMCEFCRECFFGDEELFQHMRQRHEECFLCKSSGIRDQHFLDYASLECHFNDAHFPCKDIHCQAQKFVVFGSTLDLKAHMVEQHGGDMSSRDKKEARRIEAVFDQDDGGGGSGNDGRRPGRNRVREREREPPEPGMSSNRRRDGFGATLTPATANPAPLAHLHHREEDQSTIDVDPVVVERHAAFIDRINSLTSNSTTAVSAIKSAIRSYRFSESGPRDLISTFFNVVDRDLDGTASLISALVELLDEEEKRRALLASWNGFKIEQQQQFPDLTSSAPGAEYAGITAGRVLNAKHSASLRSSQSSRQVWDRVAQAAAGSSTAPSIALPPAPAIRPAEKFPTLAASRNAPALRQPQRNTAWSAAGTASSSSAAHRPTPVPRSGAAPARRALPQISASLFPTLPSSGVAPARPAVSGNQSLKHILGEGGPPVHSAWGSGNKSNEPPPHAEADGAGSTSQKKKKGKEKQMLFTLGTFPT